MLMKKNDPITVKELDKLLDDLIKKGYGDHTIELSVNYDRCNHVQELGNVWIPEPDGNIDWITLIGVKD